MALIHVSFMGNPAAACRYCTDCPIDGKSYTLLAFSVVELSAMIVHSFTPFVLCPRSTGGFDVVTVTVP